MDPYNFFNHSFFDQLSPNEYSPIPIYEENPFKTSKEKKNESSDEEFFSFFHMDDVPNENDKARNSEVVVDLTRKNLNQKNDYIDLSKADDDEIPQQRDITSVESIAHQDCHPCEPLSIYDVELIIPDIRRKRMDIARRQMKNLFTFNRYLYNNLYSTFTTEISNKNSIYYRANITFQRDDQKIMLNLCVAQFAALFHFFPFQNRYYTDITNVNYILSNHMLYPTFLDVCTMKINDSEYKFPFIFFLLASNFHFEIYFDPNKFTDEYSSIGSLIHKKFPNCLKTKLLRKKLLEDLDGFLPLTELLSVPKRQTPFYVNLIKLKRILNVDLKNTNCSEKPNLENAIDYIEQFFHSPQLYSYECSSTSLSEKNNHQSITQSNEKETTSILEEVSVDKINSLTQLDSVIEALTVENENTINEIEYSRDNCKILQSQLFNLVIKQWRDNQDLFKELNQGMFSYKGKCLLVIDSLSKKNMNLFFEPFVHFIEKNNQYKNDSIKVIQSFLSHFGIVCTSLNNIPKQINKAFKVQNSIDAGTLSKKFASYLIPSLIELKIQQFPRKTNLMDLPTIPNISLPGGVVKVHHNKAVIIPCIMEIHRIDVNTWNDDIISLLQDSQKMSFQYIQSKIDHPEEIKLREDGVLEISLNGMKNLLNLVQNQEKTEFYFLPYYFRTSDPVQINEDEIDDPMEIEEIVEESIEKNKEKKVLGKRNKALLAPEEVSFDLLNNVSKKQKLNNENTCFVSSKTKKKRNFDNKINEFELTDSNNNISKSAKDIETGDLVNIRENDSSIPEKLVLGLDASLLDFFKKTLSQATDIIEKNASLISAIELDKIYYPILNDLANVSKIEKVFPYIRILKPYQQETVNQIHTLSKANINCLVSLGMGLGKTPIYMSLIIDAIANKNEGISVLLVPAATRNKTLKELYFWFSEMKSTVYLALANFDLKKFHSTWFYDFLKTKQNFKQNFDNKLKYWEYCKPLLDSIHKIDFTHLPGRFNDKEEVAENIKFGLKMHLEKQLKKKPDLLDVILAIRKLHYDEGKIFFDEKISLEEMIIIAKEVMKQLHPNQRDLPQDQFLEESQINNLLKFNFLNFSRISNKSKITSRKKNLTKLLHYKPLREAVQEKDSILILGYEEFKHISTTKEKDILFNAPTRIVIADEAQKYHSENSEIKKIMLEYSKALSSSNANIIPVTATPFENKLEELIELLSISNPKSIHLNEIKPLKKLLKSAVEAFSDLIIDSSEKKLNETKTLIIKSFVQSHIFSEILKKIVISLKFNSENVSRDWEDLLPIPHIKKHSINYENPVLSKKITDVTKEVFSRSEKKKSDLTILSMASSIKRLETDASLQANYTLEKSKKNSYLQIKNDPYLQKTIEMLPLKIENYKQGDIKALDDHLIAKICIEHPEISDVIKNSNKIIIGYMYDIESIMIQKIISQYYNKKVFSFGQNDKVRNKNLKEFENYQEPSILLLPVKAGGVGLNLGFVNDMILINSHWNPAVQFQFFYRILRVGRGGVRNIHTLNYDNTYNDFLRCIIKEKTRNASFFLDHFDTIQDKFNLYLKLILKKSLRNFLLSSVTPGTYELNKILHPILQKSENESQKSFQRILKEKMKEIFDLIDFDDLKKIINDATYVVEKPYELQEIDKHLSPDSWKIIPFPQEKNLTEEEFSKLASFIVDSENKKIVQKELFNLIKFLSGKHVNEVMDQARFKGDQGIIKLLELAKKEENRTNRAALYYYANGSYELDHKCYVKYTPEIPKLYVKNINGKMRIDMLMKKEDFEAILTQSNS